MRLFTTDKIVRESSIDSKHKTEQCEIFNSCKQIIKKIKNLLLQFLFPYVIFEYLKKNFIFFKISTLL